jgi:predicted metal-dependent peptidase
MNTKMKLMSQEEKDSIKALEDKAIKMIRKARLDMLREHPFYAQLAMNQKLKLDYSFVPTAGTDGFSIWFNPEFVAGMPEVRYNESLSRLNHMLTEQRVTQEQYDELKEILETKKKGCNVNDIMFVFRHEIDHIVNEHFLRRGTRDPELYNEAGDYKINRQIVKDWYKGDYNAAITKSPIIAAGLYSEQYDDLTSEQVYDLLKKERQDNKDSEDNGKCASSKGSYHMPSSSQDKPSIQSPMEEMLGLDPLAGKKFEMSKEDYQKASDKMKVDIQMASQNAGDSTPSHIRDIMKEWKKPKINWKKHLKKVIPSLIKHNHDYKRIHRRSFALTKHLKESGQLNYNQQIVLPAKARQETVSVVIAVDSSGSVTQEALHTVLSEVAGITKQYNCFEINVFCWDTKAYDVYTYDQSNLTKMKSFQLKGGGGTSLGCIVPKLEELKKIDQLVIFTDGFFNMNQELKNKFKPYSQKTLFIINDNNNFDAPFGKAINYDKYQ